MSRKAFILRDTPGGMHISTIIVGDDDAEVVEKADKPVLDAHDVEENPELKGVIIASLDAEEEMVEEADRQDHFDMVHPHLHPDEMEDVDDDVARRDGYSVP